MEIQVGEYVRTKKGFIAKVSEVDSGYVFSDDTIDIAYEECRGYVDEKEILKHSFNIIDLIEVGDYVNGKRVIYVASIENKDDEEELCVFVEATQDCIEAQDIKSIVTKEQFESIKYEV